MSGASASTATGTIATADSGLAPARGLLMRRGRFAPSPTGPLHLGSLLAAAGSYLHARARGGEWLVRIEDVDTTRALPGAADDILRTLERYGFEWHGTVVRQSERTDLYAAALGRLSAAGLTYPCSCSRQELARLQPPPAGLNEGNSDENVYPGLCRNGPLHPDRPLAVRLRVPDGEVRFIDAWQGEFVQHVGRSVGDFILRRRDGLHAYQLAVVVDDAGQGIDEVVRGCDLLDNTPRQLLLQQALGLPTPRYAHLPVLLEAQGEKLSKSRRALGIDAREAGPTLHQVLGFLQQQPPAEVARAPVREIWQWALANWQPARLERVRAIQL